MPRQLLCGLFAILIFAPSAFCEASGRRDGNWWTHQEKDTKLKYLLGFFDGMWLGGQFASFKLVGESDPCAVHALDAWNSYYQKYMADLTNEQVTDGLDAFYADYRNRKIMLFRATWVVVKTISGAPKAETDKLIDNLRAHPD